MIKSKQKSLEQSLPYSLLRLGLACNAKCLFCNVPPELYSLKEMLTHEAKAEIERLILLNKDIRLDITGGEPTIRKDLPGVVKYASKKSVKVIQVQTNGILLANKEYVKSLKAAGLNKVFVGFHSQVPKIHDYLVGVNGAFARCVKGIKNSLELGIEVILNPVITLKNYKGLPGYIKFIKRNFPQIRSISLSVVQPRGRAWINRYLVPRYGMISPYIKEALSLGSEYKLVINNPYCGVPFCIGGWYQYLEQCVEYCENILKKRKISGDISVSQDKIKAAHCVECDLNKFCNGVWREYALLYHLSDLKPIRRYNGKFRLYSGYTNL